MTQTTHLLVPALPSAGKRRTFRRTLRRAASLLLATALIPLASRAQGILTVTPAGTAGTLAGTGAVGLGGDGSAATSATLAAPSAAAYDAAGNLYLADTRNHAIRKINPAGIITTIAGTGLAGYGGDGAAATVALLDTPTGVAVDAAGNVYIADSRNNRIRKITAATGVISTIAGTGAAGFSGDGGTAISAALAQPSAVALDLSGNVYIADTNNQRIREISGTTITTIAGNGVQGFSGNGAAALSAALDSPVGVAVDSAGNVYIADRHNQRVRLLTVATGVVSTLAGSGAVTFSGSFSGDGSAATAATLSRPTGVAVDSAGNVYIADTENQRIRKLSGGTIATSAGSGVQGFGGDGGAPVSANLNSPRGVGLDVSGDLAIADKLNHRIRQAALATVAFGSTAVGTSTAGQTFTLGNTGTASITVSAITYGGAFSTSGGTCSAVPITIASGASCTVLISFMPGSAGMQIGSITFSGSNVVSTKALLSGTGTAVTPTRLVFTASPAAAITAGGNAGTVTAALEDASGNVAASDSSTLVSLAVAGPGSYAQSYVVTVSNGVATFNLSSVPLTVAGAYTYTVSATGLSSGTATETVNPSAVSALAVTGLTTFTAPQMSGTATVKAVDSYGNVATGFTGTVTLSSSDASAVFSPASYTYTASDAGSHTFTVAFNTAGTQTITAASGTVNGSETGILVEDAIWILNTTNTLARLTDAGVQTTTAGGAGAASTAGAVAFSNAGAVWATQGSTSGFVKYSAAGTLLASGTGTGGLSTPAAVFIDGTGQAWFANQGNGSISVLTTSGAAVSPSTGYQPGALSTPTAILVDSSGSVWIANAGNSTVTKVFGAAAPAVSPIVTGTVNNTLGVRP